MAKPLRVRYSIIERQVDELLAKYHVAAPAVPVAMIARGEGLEVSYRNLNDTLAGFLLREDRRMVIGVNEAHSEARQRFTLAHELGHGLLHDGDELHVDHAFRVNFRNRLSSEATDVEEIEANTFAASLLMPAQMLLRQVYDSGIDVEDDDQVARLAETYQVSRQAMSFRLLNLLSRHRVF